MDDVKWIRVGAEEHEENVLREAVECLRKGGLIVYPTETFYGLGAMALNENAVERVFRLKKRPPEKQLTVLISDLEMLKKYAAEIPPAAGLLADRFWPGSLTVIIEAKEVLLRSLKASTCKVGFRVSSDPVALNLTRLLDAPITATSANFSGFPPVTDPHELPADFLSGVDMVLDAGKVPGGFPSTIVDVEKGRVVILREGILAKEIKAFAVTLHLEPETSG